jgi:hypothetical protein
VLPGRLLLDVVRDPRVWVEGDRALRRRSGLTGAIGAARELAGRRIRGPHHACRILMMRRQCGLPRTRAPGAVDMRGMSVGPAARTRKQPPAKSGDPLAAGSLWAIQLATNLLAGLGGPASEAIEAEPSEEGRRQRVPFHGHIGRTDVRIAPPSANLQRTRQMRRAPARRRWSPPQSRWVPRARAGGSRMERRPASPRKASVGKRDLGR